MDRNRDRRFEESRRRESYRPVDRPTRSPLRNRSPSRYVADTWVPSNGRRSGRPRSRSPASLRRPSRSPCFGGRDAGGGFPRARSPPRRFSPRRDERPRSPSRSRRSRSPYGHPTGMRSPRPSRARSPPLKRGRESPATYNSRSPKRERIVSPARARYERPQSPPLAPRQMSSTLRRGGFHTSSRVPVRRDPSKEPYENSWERRSPSNVRCIRYEHGSQSQANTPRRSPPRPQRFGALHSIPSSHSPTQEVLRQNEPRTRSPRPGVKSPVRTIERYQDHSLPSPSAQSGHVSRQSPLTRHGSPTYQPQQESSSVQHDQSRQASAQETSCGSQPVISVSPSSPQVFGKPTAAIPPTGPSAAPGSASGASRAANLCLLSAPTRPKGGPAFKRESPREGPIPSLSRRGPLAIYNNPPTGPRSSFSPVSGNNDQHRPRHSSSGLSAHPRTQRSTNHLSGLPVLVPGGKLFISGFEPATEKRLAQLEIDKEKLLEQITEKQKIKRNELRDWDRLKRESEVSALRSELADEHLQRMVEGENIERGVAF